MVLPLVLIIAIGIFLLQLLMFFRVKHPVWKLIPVYFMGGYELLCVLVFFLGKVLEKEASLSFPAFILGYIGCYWAAGAVLAWAVSSLVKTIQKRRK